MRIVSFLPAATEIVCALGLNQQLLGISHGCNFPQSIENKPRVSYSDIDYDSISSKQIDIHVEESMHAKKSLYRIDKNILDELKPTHILTQALCDVCAITPSDIQNAIKNLHPAPTIIELNPRNLEQICSDILSLGKEFKREKQAEAIVTTLRKKMDGVRKKTENITFKTVFCLEWVDPLYACGHWVPEMVEIAGGKDQLSFPNAYSCKISWEKVIDENPEIIIVMACNMSIERSLKETKALAYLPFWKDLKAAKSNNVWIVDGASYFNQSGIRTIDKGIQILAKIIHPDIFGKPRKEEAINMRN